MNVAREHGMTVEVNNAGTIKIVADQKAGSELPLAREAVESF